MCGVRASDPHSFAAGLLVGLCRRERCGSADFSPMRGNLAKGQGSVSAGRFGRHVSIVSRDILIVRLVQYQSAILSAPRHRSYDQYARGASRVSIGRGTDRKSGVLCTRIRHIAERYTSLPPIRRGLWDLEKRHPHQWSLYRLALACFQFVPEDEQLSCHRIAGDWAAHSLLKAGPWLFRKVFLQRK